jgi:putative ABC transport system ATP-binding protein
LHYGDRVIVMEKGEIIKDISGEEKKRMTLADLFLLFEESDTVAEVM